MINYTDEEIQMLYDSLHWSGSAGGNSTCKTVVWGPSEFYSVAESVDVLKNQIYAIECTHRGYIIRSSPAIGTGYSDYEKIVVRSSFHNIMEKIFHVVPLDDIPLYINNKYVGHIAAWRLKIAK